MKNKSYLKESIECFLVITVILTLFLGVIYISGELTGTDWSSVIPDFSWDMFNTWDEIINGRA